MYTNPLYNFIHDKNADNKPHVVLDGTCKKYHKQDQQGQTYYLLQLFSHYNSKPLHYENEEYRLTEDHLSIYKDQHKTDNPNLANASHYTATYQSQSTERQIKIRIYMNFTGNILIVNQKYYRATLLIDATKSEIVVDSQSENNLRINCLGNSSSLLTTIFQTLSEEKRKKQTEIDSKLQEATGNHQRLSEHRGKNKQPLLQKYINSLKSVINCYEWLTKYTEPTAQQKKECSLFQTMLTQYTRKASEKKSITKEKAPCPPALDNSMPDTATHSSSSSTQPPQLSHEKTGDLLNQINKKENELKKTPKKQRDIIWFSKYIQILKQRFECLDSKAEKRILETTYSIKTSLKELEALINSMHKTVLSGKKLPDNALQMLQSLDALVPDLGYFPTMALLILLIELKDLDFFKKIIASRNDLGLNTYIYNPVFCLLFKAILMHDPAYRFKFTECLLASNSMVNISDAFGNSPLMLAVVMNDLKTTELLLKYGANPNAIRKNSVSLLSFDKAGADTLGQLFGEIKYDYNTPIIEACSTRNSAIIKILLTYGADPTLRNNREFHALSAYLYPNTRLTFSYESLYPSLQTPANSVPLSNEEEASEIIHLLINHGCKINDKIGPNKQMTSLLYAIQEDNGDNECMLLLKFGADPKISGGFHNINALLMATFKNRGNILKTLLSRNNNSVMILKAICVRALLKQEDESAKESAETLITLLTHKQNMAWTLIRKMIVQAYGDSNPFLLWVDQVIFDSIKENHHIQRLSLANNDDIVLRVTVSETPPSMEELMSQWAIYKGLLSKVLNDKKLLGDISFFHSNKEADAARDAIKKTTERTPQVSRTEIPLNGKMTARDFQRVIQGNHNFSQHRSLSQNQKTSHDKSTSHVSASSSSSSKGKGKEPAYSPSPR